MQDAAAPTPLNFSEIRVREPAGERTFDAALTIGGGEGAQVIVPGVAGIALTIERRQAIWTVDPAPGADVRLDARPLKTARDLRRGDVLTLGAAQVVVTDFSRTLLRLDVRHLVGNDTIAPLGAIAALIGDAEADEIEIRVPLGEASPALGDARELRAPVAQRAPLQPPRPRWLLPMVGAAVLALAALFFFTLALQGVALDIQPADARVGSPGTLALHFGDQLYVFPGMRTVRAERSGYEPAETQVNVQAGLDTSARLRLTKLPGVLVVDTHGITATVSVDGVELGRAPGELAVRAGSHTVTVRAPRYLDHIGTVEVEGAGNKQSLDVKLEPAWGTLHVSAKPAAAQLAIDDEQRGSAPASIELPQGVHRISLAAAGFKTWQTSVVVKPGETLDIGPIELGQPDAELTVRTTPAGADVTVGGMLRGRSPLTVSLPSGINYDVVASLAGHEDTHRTVFGTAGSKLRVEAALAAVSGAVVVDGEPAGAEVLLDGTPRGTTPQTLQLSAIEHRLEVRSEGYQSFTSTVTPARGLERVIRYHLISSDRGKALEASTPLVKTKGGYELRLVAGGAFAMGSDRREQGRRPNESLRTVTLKRPYYIGVREVTNEEFRKFRPTHVSGYIGKTSLDLDAHPVTKVDWEAAVEYCNWLSEQEGFAPAYEKRGTSYALKTQVNAAYRLPTEAEWEYAARYAAPERLVRFAWGDALPVAAAAGNIAGAEVGAAAIASLASYRDEYPMLAPVGKFPATPLGLQDMSGNVSEWVNDRYLSFVDSAAVTDPFGPDEGAQHVIRGSNWESATVAELRLAWREAGAGAGSNIGFRVARYAEEEEKP